MQAIKAATILSAAFKDICNAADNCTPYTVAELCGEAFAEAHNAQAEFDIDRPHELYSKWSAWYTNPFHAIKAIAAVNGTPCDFDKAVVALTEPATAWFQNFDGTNMLDDVLQEIAGATNIVVQYSQSGRMYRAAYDN